jgi:hypothetical protein
LPSVVHAAAAQTWVFGSQTPEVQSAGTAQERPFAHLLGQEPPQSTSVSVPFLKPSPQVGAAQSRVEGLQNPEVQSVDAAQPPPIPHVFPWATQVAPPQSVPVSEPFFTPSEQVGAGGVAHSFEALQKPEVQSELAAHPTPSAQVRPSVRQSGPPQSTPVSLPFFTPSVHVGGVAGWVEVFPPLPPQPAIARAIASASASRLKMGHAKLDMALPSVNRRKQPGENHRIGCLSTSRRASRAQEVGARLTDARSRRPVVLGG